MPMYEDLYSLGTMLVLANSHFCQICGSRLVINFNITIGEHFLACLENQKHEGIQPFSPIFKPT